MGDSLKSHFEKTERNLRDLNKSKCYNINAILLVLFNANRTAKAKNFGGPILSKWTKSFSHQKLTINHSNPIFSNWRQNFFRIFGNPVCNMPQLLSFKLLVLGVKIFQKVLSVMIIGHIISGGHSASGN